MATTDDLSFDRNNFVKLVAAFTGGSVMVWTGISYKMIVNRTLTAERYINEILEHVVPTLRRMENRFILMQDNARPQLRDTYEKFSRQQRGNAKSPTNVSRFEPNRTCLGHAWVSIAEREVS